MFGLALVFRVALVTSYQAPGGDGIQYYRLSQTLRAHRMLAPSHLPGRLSYSRLPGYPLFLAHVAVRKAPYGLEAHLRRATRANVVLDLVTGSLVALIALHLRRRLGARFGAGVALAGFLGIVLAPPMCLLASYAMTESLATMIGTLEVALALLLLEGEYLWPAAVLTGLVAGLNQLVRADALSFAPAVAIALFAAPLRWKQRLLAMGVVLAVAATVFSPWPIRNLRVFGQAHPFASYWRTIDGGRPLPMGPIAWARTWASSLPGESYFDYSLAQENKLKVDRPGIILPTMYDSPAERDRVRALFERYNAEDLSPDVNAAFSALAAERRARRPYHVYVELPLARLAHIWSPVPYWELPMKVDWLGIGEDRERLCRYWDYSVYALALLGVFSLLRARATLALCSMLVAPIVLRSVMLALTVAVGATERHIVEIHPLLIVLALIGLVQRGRRARA